MRLTKPANTWSFFFIATLAALITLLNQPAGATESANDTNSLLEQAEALYSQRDNPAKALEAAGLFRKAIELMPDNEQAMIGLVQSLCWVGAVGRVKNESTLYKEAIAVANKAVEKWPDRPAPRYWRAAARGMLTTCTNKVHALALVDEIKTDMKKLLTLDPNYQGAGAYRVLGRVYTQVPEVLGGDRDKAEKYLRQAVNLAPWFLTNQLYLADLWYQQERFDEARNILVQVKSAGVRKGYEPEARQWKMEASKLLHRLDNKVTQLCTDG
jgi:tetratricopeptide (TPR) repeat protein